MGCEKFKKLYTETYSGRRLHVSILKQNGFKLEGILKSHIYQSNKFIQVKKFIKDITAREFATAIALRKTIKRLKIQNAISFHSSILRAENFSKQQEFITKFLTYLRLN